MKRDATPCGVCGLRPRKVKKKKHGFRYNRRCNSCTKKRRKTGKGIQRELGRHQSVRSMLKSMK